MFKPYFGISLQGESEGPHADIVMFYLKKVREMFKVLYIFLTSQVFRLSIKLGEVLVISRRKIMEDRRQLKWFISAWRNWGDKVRYDR